MATGLGAGQLFKKAPIDAVIEQSGVSPAQPTAPAPGSRHTRRPTASAHGAGERFRSLGVVFRGRSFVLVIEAGVSPARYTKRSCRWRVPLVMQRSVQVT